MTRRPTLADFNLVSPGEVWAAVDRITPTWRHNLTRDELQGYLLEADFDLIKAALRQISSTDAKPPKLAADPVQVSHAIARIDDTLHDSYAADRPPYTAVYIGVTDYLVIVRDLEAKLGPRFDLSGS